MYKVRILNAQTFSVLQYLVENWFKDMANENYTIIAMTQSESMAVSAQIHQSYTLTIVYKINEPEPKMSYYNG